MYNKPSGFNDTNVMHIIIVDSAVSALIVSDEFNVKANCSAPGQYLTEVEAGKHTAFLIQSYEQKTTSRSLKTGDTTLTYIETVGNLHNDILNGRDLK